MCVFIAMFDQTTVVICTKFTTTITLDLFSEPTLLVVLFLVIFYIVVSTIPLVIWQRTNLTLHSHSM